MEEKATVAPPLLASEASLEAPSYRLTYFSPHDSKSRSRHESCGYLANMAFSQKVVFFDSSSLSSRRGCQNNNNNNNERYFIPPIWSLSSNSPLVFLAVASPSTQKERGAWSINLQQALRQHPSYAAWQLTMLAALARTYGPGGWTGWRLKRESNRARSFWDSQDFVFLDICVREAGYPAKYITVGSPTLWQRHS